MKNYINFEPMTPIQYLMLINNTIYISALRKKEEEGRSLKDVEKGPQLKTSDL